MIVLCLTSIVTYHLNLPLVDSVSEFLLHHLLICSQTLLIRETPDYVLESVNGRRKKVGGTDIICHISETSLSGTKPMAKEVKGRYIRPRSRERYGVQFGFVYSFSIVQIGLPYPISFYCSEPYNPVVYKCSGKRFPFP